MMPWTLCKGCVSFVPVGRVLHICICRWDEREVQVEGMRGRFNEFGQDARTSHRPERRP